MLDTKIVIYIQKSFRTKRLILEKVNTDLRFIYTIIFSIMTRTHESFSNGLFAQTVYNKILTRLDGILQNFHTLNYPLTLRVFKSYTIKSIMNTVKKMRIKLLKISLECGTNTLDDMIQLFFNKSIHTLPFVDGNYYRKLRFFNRVFIGISCSYYKVEYINDDVNITSVYDNTEIVKKRHKDDTRQEEMDISTITGGITYPTSRKGVKQQSLLQKIQGARLYIPYLKHVLAITGYFREDPLNINRIGGTLGEKQCQLSESIKVLNVPKNFKYSFIEQLSLRDFFVNSSNELTERCNSAYTEFKKLKSKPISYLVKEFLLSDIERQRTILTLFLLNKDDSDNQSLAYLMYDMISNESYLLKPQPLAQQVFNSLHWSVQRLFNSAIKKVDGLNTNIKNFREDDIPYEKRIVLMKCNDSTKQKVMEKLKELNNSKGDSNTKAQHYVDSILKIPFGIYKEEPIFQYMNEYRSTIKTIAIALSKCVSDFKSDKITEIDQILDDTMDYTGFITMNKINRFYSDIKRCILGLRDDIDEKTIMNKYSKMVCGDLREQLKSKGLPISGKKSILVSRLVKYNYMNTNKSFKRNIEILDTEFQKYYVKWNKYNDDKREYINRVSGILDDAVYGLDDAKNQIKRIIAQWINGEMKGYAFGFEGPPGTGKTTLAKRGISKCLIDYEGNSRPFAFIALGGSSNGSTLEGHNYTYVGSTYGRIVDILMETRCMNPIIYIDELDKISKTEHGKEIVGILTHLTDTTQNDNWCDKYFSGVKLDLSRVLFIFSYNDPALIDKILLDRIHRIKTKALNKTEKVRIVQDYLLPELLNTVGFNKGDILISDEVIEHIVDTYTYEAGVRKLKEKLFELLRELNLQYLMGELFEIPYVLTEERIDKIFINKDKIIKKRILGESRVGLVNGLFATTSGIGGITIIETYRSLSENRLSLELTGKQGEVMRESMSVAKTVAWNLLSTNIQKQVRDNTPYGIHIHCPEAATPKDGPSAGGAITIAILSQILGVRVNNLCAMTGEIDLNGSIHQIGGLESKLYGARVAGVRRVLIPESNRNDYEKILNSKDCRICVDDPDFEVILVKHIHEVIPHFLLFSEGEEEKYLNLKNHMFVL